MRFIAVYGKGAIMTDDYDLREIHEGLHIRHLKGDIRYLHIKSPVTVYDENMRFVCKLNKKKTA